MNTIIQNDTDTLTRADGRKIPKRAIPALRILEHETAQEIVAIFEEIRAYNERRKEEIFEKVGAYRDLAYQEYGARLGGNAGGMTIRTYDERISVIMAQYTYQSITSALPVAQALVNEILDDLVEGSSDDIRAIVSEAFARDETTGRVNVQKIMGLSRLELAHPRWPEAQRALRDAVAISGRKLAVRCTRRDTPEAAPRQVVVDFSKL